MAEIPVPPAERGAALEERRRLKMAASAHAYVRGNTLRFYEWLRADAKPKALPAGPPLWICGDCHIGNLGPVADLDGNVAIQIRDLDQTVIGNPAHDLLRLGLSLAMAARSSDLPGVTTALMVEVMLGGYLHGLTGRKPRVATRDVAPIRKVMRSSLSRKWRHLAAEHIVDARPTIPLGRKFWPLTAAERAGLARLFETEDRRQLVAALLPGDPEAPVTLHDAAYWVKGCSSLGRVRYAALIGIGKKRARRYSLIDIKEAAPTVAPRAQGAVLPRDDAERVVAGARRLSPFLGGRMVAARLGGKRVVIRELRPQDLKFEFAGLSREEAILTARLLAGVVGKAHGRQLSRPARTAWARELKARHGRGLDAPSWLWNGVVDLVAVHEGAYLRYCRQVALSAARAEAPSAGRR